MNVIYFPVKIYILNNTELHSFLNFRPDLGFPVQLNVTNSNAEVSPSTRWEMDAETRENVFYNWINVMRFQSKLKREQSTTQDHKANELNCILAIKCAFPNKDKVQKAQNLGYYSEISDSTLLFCLAPLLGKIQ